MKEETFGDIIEEIKAAVSRMMDKGYASPTVFEIETATAFLFFVKEKCDYVLLETGLGGRLDATNVVKNTMVCAFSSISMDHMGALGNTLEEITMEKAGIIKAGAKVVSAPQNPAVMKILMEASENRTQFAEMEELHVCESNLEEQLFSYKEFKNMKIRLIGENQTENAATALEIVLAMRESGVNISGESVRIGLEKAEWPGRFQVLKKDPLIIADGAHNADAAKRLAQNVEKYLQGRKLVAIMGVFQDKEYQKIIEIMKPYLEYVFAIDLPNRERTLEKEKLVHELHTQQIPAEVAEEISDALKLAKEKADKNQAILVFGSLSYLGEVIRLEGRT